MKYVAGEDPAKRRNALPFIGQYCWSVDGLGVAVVLICLHCFICRGVDVGCLFKFVSGYLPYFRI
jgi:hypothetical protein